MESKIKLQIISRMNWGEGGRGGRNQLRKMREGKGARGVNGGIGERRGRQGKKPMPLLPSLLLRGKFWGSSVNDQTNLKKFGLMQLRPSALRSLPDPFAQPWRIRLTGVGGTAPIWKKH